MKAARGAQRETSVVHRRRGATLMHFEAARVLSDECPVESAELSRDRGEARDRVTIHPDALASRAERLVPTHPFRGLSAGAVARASSDYFTMSAMFPYIQSAATARCTSLALELGTPIPPDLAATFPVAAFLVSDELGIHFKVMTKGNAALPSILDAEDFHSELLRRDFLKLFGAPVDPTPSPTTVVYLKALMEGLSCPDAVRRSAMMASFEVHANRMIEALWASIADAYAVDKNDLAYFRVHVGGDDPAEAYHVAMTAKMLSKTVTPESRKRFFKEFDAAYLLHADWCAAIVGDAGSR
jgi:hypothetical protein